ncbi:MAG: hypothetical protein WKF84_18240 [Pyrinomonadaceae bacterium]
MLEHWRGAVSDDFAMTRALQHEELPIVFVPQCLVASHEDVSWSELLEFTTRQIKITRVYAPHLWQIVLWTNLIFVAVFFGGVIIITWQIIAGRGVNFTASLRRTYLLFGCSQIKLSFKGCAHGSAGRSDEFACNWRRASSAAVAARGGALFIQRDCRFVLPAYRMARNHV